MGFMPEPIVSVAQMRAREMQTWATGVTPESVIQRAGMAVAEAALRMTQPGAPVLVLAGHGHNGDDAEVASVHLKGRDVLLLRLTDPDGFARGLRWLSEHRGRWDALVVDGLFGIGLNRPLTGSWAELVDAVNASGVSVLSVDVPSGLDADSGQPRGIAVKATRTLTLGSVKRGLLAEDAASWVGRLELASDIGLVAGESEATCWWTEARDFAGYPPRRPESSHKGTFGHVAVVAGSPGFHGAAVLTARGALRARPGLVSVITDAGCYVPVACALQSAMVRKWGGERWDGGGITALVVGPGLASASLSPAWRTELVRVWREARCPVVVDASALDGLPLGGSCAGLRVVTPHPGEAARLLVTGRPLPPGETPSAPDGKFMKSRGAAVQKDRMEALGGLISLWPGTDLWVVLKGRHTLVGAEGRGVWVNSSGNPGLAQGGSGDVLAGYLGGLLAQPGLAADAGRAVRYGVWRHGAIADALEATGEAWTTEDLADAMGRVI